MIKRLLAILLICLMSAMTVSCSNSETKEPLQMQEGSGQHVARIYVKDYGSFDLRLFSDEAEETVKSFMDYAEAGFYDGKNIYSVIEDYCLLMGDNKKQTEINEDASKAFKNASKKLYPFTGSLCVIDDGSGTDAGHFMIVTADAAFLSELKELLAYKLITPQEYFKTAYGKDIDEDTLNLFYKYGGAPWLMGSCIVFGQIYDGMDVVENISKVLVTEDSSYAPLDEILIDHIEVK